MSYRIIRHGETIASDVRAKISGRYKTITRALNMEFWGTSSDVDHSIYVGSYGRGTAIDSSDIDVLVVLPKTEYYRFDSLKGNGQSRLLQTVKGPIQAAYPRTEVRADGQVVVVLFTDGIKFEILPAFVEADWFGNKIYQYPETNMGGNWKSTNPKAEQNAMKTKERSSNGLLFDTCKHLRFIRDSFYSSYHLSGIVIDSFAYEAIEGWSWSQPSSMLVSQPGDYEKHLLEYYITHFRYTNTLTAPGSNQAVNLGNSREGLERVLIKITE